MKSKETNGVSVRKYNQMAKLHNQLREQTMDNLTKMQIAFCVAYRCHSVNAEYLYDKVKKQPAGGEGEG